jgi:hypothetical protein
MFVDQLSGKSHWREIFLVPFFSRASALKRGESRDNFPHKPLPSKCYPRKERTRRSKLDLDYEVACSEAKYSADRYSGAE